MSSLTQKTYKNTYCMAKFFKNIIWCHVVINYMIIGHLGHDY